MGDPQNLSGDKKIGVIHRVNQEDVLDADPITLGDATEGVSLANCVREGFQLNDDIVRGGLVGMQLDRVRGRLN